MGELVDGVWHETWYDTKKSKGHFMRKDAHFRGCITADGAPGPDGRKFAAEPGRYHLYVSYACPWAHRALIFRELKGLQGMIGLSVVHPNMGVDGWTFHEGEGVVPDPVGGATFLREVYTKADPTFTGRVTVPVLWDKKDATIVSNESAEIIRMFNSGFDKLGAKSGDFYPIALREEIDSVNERIYNTLNNGVYKCGFATTQEAYELAFKALFATMDWLEARLAKQRYLAGERVTEADWRLFTTMVRFDAVYVGHFKTNLRRLVDYPNLWAYTRELYQTPGVSDTVNMAHIKGHYYGSHKTINPTGIVPVGPDINFAEAHGRGSLAGAG